MDQHILEQINEQWQLHNGRLHCSEKGTIYHHMQQSG